MDYEKLYKAYYLQVYSYTISLAKNREIAEEITQNTPRLSAFQQQRQHPPCAPAH